MNERFDEWAILELMGHRKLAGRVTDASIGGSSFIRIDVPGEKATVATQYYSPSSVYCITPTSESVARRVSESNTVEPVTLWEIHKPVEESFLGYDEEATDE